MTDQEIEITDNEPAPDNNSLVEGLRRILMAGIGMVVLAQEEIEDFVTRLVERGEIAESDGRNLVSDVLEKRKESIDNNRRKVSDNIDRRIESTLNRLNVPTKSEISMLSKQIEDLSQKVDDLREME